MAKFRARARAVDMLGRQQIAGIPTAINELFKNAHDAYADTVVADFFREEGALAVRDDGVGMTRSDFEERWLVVGTESKVVDRTRVLRGTNRRPILGEKGIGRLAVAAIGPQVVVVTKSASSTETTVALVNWTLFTVPAIDLVDVEIPIISLSGGDVVSGATIARLRDQLQLNVRQLGDRIPSDIRRDIDAQLTSITSEQVDRLLLRLRRGPDLREAGTLFLIAPTDQMLLRDIKESDRGDDAPELLRMLVGFTDTMVPGRPRPAMAAYFFDHRSSDDVVDIIGGSEFFTSDDFLTADHRIQGTFDEYGQFVGTVSVYDRGDTPHRIPWTKAQGRRTLCGPFTLDLAYVQGNRSQSTLSPEEFNRMLRKLTRVGGLYIYRDNVRILPYGNSDFDWLDIEQTRSKSAADFFWSHRRLFGSVAISSDQNPLLEEKAGREGFRSNAAYREFRDILQNFLWQMARDFFREDSPDETWRVRREELDRQERARRRYDSQARSARSSFRQQINALDERLSGGEPELRIQELIARLNSSIRSALGSSSDNESATILLAAEQDAKKELGRLRADFRLVKPRSIVLPKSVERDLENYQLEFEVFDSTILRDTQDRIESSVTAAARQLGDSVSNRSRLEAGVGDLISTARSTLSRQSRDLQLEVSGLQERITKASKTISKYTEDGLREIQSDINSTGVDVLTPQAVTELRRGFEQRIEALLESQTSAFEQLNENLRLVSRESVEAEFGDTVDVISSLESELAALRIQADQDLELAQLGLALQVINHEFSASIRSVRNNLRRLRSWADANKKLQVVYNDLRASFEHLDAYLRLFTPLNRRLYRRDTVIDGSAIEAFIRDLFAERFERHLIDFRVTESFRKKRIRAYPSTVYPVFVNLVDNAVHWLATVREPRIIALSSRGPNILIEDNGPGISEIDRERVFELGYSRKQNGRGMGLHISRDVLRKESWNLVATDSQLGGAAFLIVIPGDAEV